MYSSPDSPTEELVALISGAFKKKSVKWTKPHTGLTVAQRFVITFEDGSRLFVKAAMDDLTEECLRIDHLIMTTLKEDFVPEVLVWLEPPGQRPVLVIEDLSNAHWPANHDPVLWQPGQFEILFETLKRVAALTAPESLPAATSPASSYWRTIAEEPEAFSQLELCSDRWLEQALPTLIAAEEQVVLEGDALVHDDVRSDNLCFFDKRMVLVDWSQARRGSPLHDLSFVLSTLPLEGGPDPYKILPEGGDWAAYRSGQFALRATKEIHAPAWLIKVFQRLVIITSKWAASSLKLPTWDGKDWREI